MAASGTRSSRPRSTTSPGVDAGTVSGGTEQLIRLYAGHGTFIAGIIGCVAPGASVFVERSFELAGTRWEYELGPALLRGAADRPKPDIISLSAGGTSHMRKHYLGLKEFLDALAADDHTLLVAAAGNEGVPQVLTPAAGEHGEPSRPRIVAVGALRADGSGRCVLQQLRARCDGVRARRADGRRVPEGPVQVRRAAFRGVPVPRPRAVRRLHLRDQADAGRPHGLRPTSRSGAARHSRRRSSRR